MKDFALNFSEKLREFALKHRPPAVKLTPNRIEKLCRLSGYRFEYFNYKKFTVLHPDNLHGFRNGLTVVWQVRTDGYSLFYYPTLEYREVQGYSFTVLDEMIIDIEPQLPGIGIDQEISVPLGQPAVIVPHELNSPVSVMYLSELKEAYYPLFLYLKERIFHET